MKIAYTGLDLPEGKVKYPDPIVTALADKFQPKKVSPYFFEFLPDAYEDADAIVVAEDNMLDLTVLDMEKIENRLSRVESESERVALQRCLDHVETGKPACDFPCDDDERAIITTLAPVSFRPTLVFAQTPPIEDLCPAVMAKANMMFFYTTGPQEVHAWFVPKGIDAVGCAAKIHTDLARGFIKAELVSFDDLMQAHNLQDARTKGLTRLVDRDHVVEERSILDIRFNV